MLQESACPHCGCQSIGMDVIYAEGACRFCQDCMTRGPRVPVSMETPYADQLSRATSAWNEWAESTHLQQASERGNNDLRFSA